MTNEMYVRPKYAVSALECYNNLIKIIENDTLKGITISRKEYAERMKISLEVYAEINRIDENWSQTKKENAFIVDIQEPSFEWWFSIYLSLIEEYEVALILDEYNKKWKNTNVKFTDFLENIILHIQKNNLFHDFKDVTKEIVSWVRENRKGLQNIDQTNIIINVINIQYNDYRSFYKNFEEHYHTSKSKKDNKEEDNDIGTSTLFNSPFHGYLLNELLEFCEEDSKDSLRKVLRGVKIESPVIFKLNFKKKSLRDSLKTLISKGDMKMNQKECAVWLYNNFRIRKNNGVDEFGVAGTHDAFRILPTQTVNSQLKFDDWYKINK